MFIVLIGVGYSTDFYYCATCPSRLKGTIFSPQTKLYSTITGTPAMLAVVPAVRTTLGRTVTICFYFKNLSFNFLRRSHIRFFIFVEVENEKKNYKSKNFKLSFLSKTITVFNQIN